MIEVHVESHVSIITLNRPEAANAMSTALLDEMNKALDSVDANYDNFCTILTGKGEKAFCAGADLKERKTMTDREVVRAVRYIGQTVNRVESMRMPVIAALNGVAFGGGLELALACDLRIAAEHAKLGLTETSLAIIPGAGGTQRLSRLIGPGQAKRLIYTAKSVAAHEAKKLGILEEVVSSSELLHESKALADTIATKGPVALEQAKLAINRGLETDLMTGLEIEHLAYQKTIPTRDREEGLQAFSEKRKPIYKGE
ncbi:enoyl-CoA hydratase [Oceanobacillus alkalisoli]|uniref:enoyl-CoA hydratase n=1 Tax=Oceanobacillus alkalisoli TaxID=2925113 RepID=UPI001EE4E958|nr:enoyl-CoA hydratase [Oceanobacillus alkalisoli]MCG5105148.1 enoyl-CoA hydratase [Oceanobacillus alkalisoli]